MRKIYLKNKGEWIEAKPWILDGGKWRAATDYEVEMMLRERKILMHKFLGPQED